MKDIMDKLEYKGKEYTLIFNFNVLEDIQEQYGTLDQALGEAYGKDTGEPSIKALSFIVMSMLNEGIDIDNETKEIPEKLLTQKQTNRILSNFVQANGVNKVVNMVDTLMAKSLQGGEDSKNESSTKMTKK